MVVQIKMWSPVHCIVLFHGLLMCLCIVCGSVCLLWHVNSKECWKILKLVHCYMIVLLTVSWDTTKGTTSIMSDIRWIFLHVLTSDLKVFVIAISIPASYKSVISTSIIPICSRKGLIRGFVIILELISNESVISSLVSYHLIHIVVFLLFWILLHGHCA